MKKLVALMIALLMLSSAATAFAVTYTEDGGMVVNGNGDDDFSNLQTADPDAIYITVILPGEPEVQYDEFGNLITPGPGPTYAPGETLDVWLVNEDGTEEAVTLVHAGSRYCDVKKGRQNLHVATERLRYDVSENLPPEKRFAYVNAKRIGYATMHTRASVKSDVVNRCTTNQMCLVLDVGRSYSKVWCMGAVGYIKNSSLYYINADAEEPIDATITYKGRASTRNTINIRQNGKVNSRILGDVSCGSPALIFAESEDGWYEVEVGGWRCYVQTKYATYNSVLYNPVIIEASAPDQTPPPQIITQEENTVSTSDLTQIIFFDAAEGTIANLGD